MSSENPYQGSEFAADPIDRSPGGIVPATQGKRFLTYIIDAIRLYIANFAIGMVFGILLFSSGIDPAGLTAQLLSTLLGLIVAFGYYATFEAISGKTIGKMAMGTRVVSADGGPATTGQILGRSLCRFIPFEFVSFFLGDSKRPRGWHDTIPDTYVVEG